MIETHGHQTVEKTTESIGQRIQLGPIKSYATRNGKNKKHPPFAGDGYYFWEDNIEAAEWWGLVHYTNHNKSFRIFRIDIELKHDDSSLLDLVGSRQAIRLIKKLIDKTKKSVDCHGWKLHNYIKYFRLLESKYSGMFPFKMIRFNDFSLNPKVQEPLALTDYNHVALLNPFYIICVFEIEDLNLKSFTFIK